MTYALHYNCYPPLARWAWPYWRLSLKVQKDGFGISLGPLSISYGPVFTFDISDDDIEWYDETDSEGEAD